VFLTLAGPAEARIRERASVFLAYAAPAADEAAARTVLAGQERAHRDASHWCSAWALRDGVRRANDAGEPAGSAGAPILATIEGAGLVDTVVVVTRWFGGTRLGVGGLVRAYGDAAAAALALAPKREGRPALRVRIRYPYDCTAAVMRALEHAGAAEMVHGFADGGQAGIVDAAIPADASAALRENLRDATSAVVAPETTGRTLLFRTIR
jgi:putative IMPACT (imprinted ancient) family translation regulator